ncbi:MAG TPA: HPr(Ser) kinase/phosphatase [Deltaproteobacteria bacterium]|nr:MAG: HPr(Ser) kinase/phosphatase [Deltaproteobacteria bacterium GWA2_45_12]HBF13218.1 HPr(Ser) kinase/phosphatase [Deltaproteobacteria bacterium]
MLQVSVAELLKKDSQLNLKTVAGKKGIKRSILSPRIQKPGLALIGNTSKLHSGRVQILGKAEITYLKSLSGPKLSQIVLKMAKARVACFVVTRDNPVPKPLVGLANKHKIPILSTPLITSIFINRVTRFLEDYLTDATTVHGVLMDVFGVGILIIGKSGIGKSECALDLIMRGHRLVADDVVEIRKKSSSTLWGMASPRLQFHMEVRGLGILNIKDLFGVAATRDRKLIEIVAEIVEWNPKHNYDRLGMDQVFYTILDVSVPYIKIPVSSGRNVSTIIEVAARNTLLKARGIDSSKMFLERLDRDLADYRQDEETETPE